MKEILNSIYRIAPYLAFLPVILGLFRWKYLDTSLRIFMVIITISGGLGLLSVHTKDTNFLYYINALVSVSLYGLFFEVLLKNIVARKVIWGAVALMWVIIGGFIFKNGIHLFQTQVFIPFDLMMIAGCGYYLVHYLKTVIKAKDATFFLILTLFVNFCFVFFIDLVSTFLYLYFSNNFFNILWGVAIPLVNLLKISAFCLVFLLARYQPKWLDKIPDLDH